MEWEEVLGNPVPSNPSEEAIHGEADSVEDFDETSGWDAETWKLLGRVLEGMATLKAER